MGKKLFTVNISNQSINKNGITLFSIRHISAKCIIDFIYKERPRINVTLEHLIGVAKQVFRHLFVSDLQIYEMILENISTTYGKFFDESVTPTEGRVILAALHRYNR